MAEFQEVMRQANRMCASYANDCTDCGLRKEDYACPFDNLPEGMDLKSLPEIERVVMDWAEKHPEPRYPSWNEAWKQLFPDARRIYAPCIMYFVEECPYDSAINSGNCDKCRNTPIPADIAEKLGVKPLEVTK